MKVKASDLWLEYLVGCNCGLCNNSGMLQVRDLINDKIESRPCICPNGRAMKEHKRKKEHEKQIDLKIHCLPIRNLMWKVPLVLLSNMALLTEAIIRCGLLTKWYDDLPVQIMKIWSRVSRKAQMVLIPMIGMKE